MIKKISFSLLVGMIIFSITGCSESNSNVTSNNNLNTDDSVKVMNCSRTASGGEGVDVELNYTLYYKNEDLIRLHSVEKVNSTLKEKLDLYEDAYKKIHTNYEGLKYYDTNVIRDDTSVVNDTTIYYDLIDIDRLLEIEGEEDNIIENGKAKVKAWLTLAKKFGTTCEEEK